MKQSKSDISQTRKNMRVNGRPLTYVSFGDANPDINFYLIWPRDAGLGFFANFFYVIGHLSVAEQLGMIPIVDMETYQTHYQEDEPIHGTNNAWEYYFNQVSSFTLENVYTSKNVYFSNGDFEYSIYESISILQQYIKRYIVIQPEIEEWVENFYKVHFQGKHVLGVHFRGQEMKTAKGHPTPPKIQQVLQKIQKMLDTFSIDSIFVVTEEQKYLDKIEKSFPGKVFYTNAFRTYDVNAYTMYPHPRPLHMYNLGLDVLRDTLLLAKCHYLIAGGKDGIASGSNVSRMAQVYNDGNYIAVELIYNGMNSSVEPLTIHIKNFLKLCWRPIKYIWQPVEHMIKKVFHLQGVGRRFKHWWQIKRAHGFRKK